MVYLEIKYCNLIVLMLITQARTIHLLYLAVGMVMVHLIVYIV